MKIALPRASRSLCAALTVVGLACSASVHAEEPKKPCAASESKTALATRSDSLAAAVKHLSSARCGTFDIAVRRFLSTQINAGRKLEPTAPLDVNAATAQLKTARDNPEFQTALASELQGVTDETVKALLEIALLDDMDYNKARDLRLLELRKEAGK